MLCKYCNNSAFFTLKNGSYCCESRANKCPAVREKNSKGQKGKIITWDTSKGQFKAGGTPHNRGKRSDRTEFSIELIESGEYIKLGEPAIRRHVKRYLIRKNGHKCQICNNFEWLGQPISLVCDHIDGDSLNNDLNNFRVICNNCDAQLPTYKSRNRGNGRQYDRKRYQKNTEG